MTIVEFLEARISEDEARINYAPKMSDPFDMDMLPLRDDLRTRLLAECAAKRDIVLYVANARFDLSRGAEADAQYRAVWWTATRLASVYKDHPDYQQEWSL